MASIFEYTPVNNFREPLTNGIAIVAGKPNFDQYDISDSLYEELKECGFNAVSAHIVFDPNSQDISKIKKSIERSYEHKIKLLLYHDYLLYDIDYYLNKISYKAPGEQNNDLEWAQSLNYFGGWFLKGKVSVEDLNDAVLFHTYNLLTYKYNDRVFMGVSVNWDELGNQETQVNEDYISYPKYVSLFQQLYQPSFWPVAYFPDYYKKNAEKHLDIYFKTLQYFAYISRYTCTPFWSFCRCQAFSGIDGYRAPAPTEESMRRDIFSALAYGAQGIYFWNYRQRENKNGIEYSHAPIDFEGRPTATQQMVKNIIKEVRAFDKIFFGCEVLDCRHITYLLNMDSVKKWEHPMGPLENIEASKGLNVLISQIFNKEENNEEGKNYLVLLNYAMTRFIQLPSSIIAYNPIPEITLSFNRYWNVFRITLEGDKMVETKLEAEDYTKKYDFDYSNYLIFRWE